MNISKFSYYFTELDWRDSNIKVEDYLKLLHFYYTFTFHIGLEVINDEAIEECLEYFDKNWELKKEEMIEKSFNLISQNKYYFISVILFNTNFYENLHCLISDLPKMEHMDRIMFDAHIGSFATFDISPRGESGELYELNLFAGLIRFIKIEVLPMYDIKCLIPPLDLTKLDKLSDMN